MNGEMRKLTFVLAFWALACCWFAGCGNKGDRAQGGDSALVLTGDTIVDSTIYGVCGEGTTMHMLELVTDAGDTLAYMVDDEDGATAVVQGGLLVGDRLAVTDAGDRGGDRAAKKVINLTTLLGKWTSLDKNFEILEGGVVKSSITAETNPWTDWKILNGRLLLNSDTFDINRLSADSLYLENSKGIFVFKRQSLRD